MKTLFKIANLLTEYQSEIVMIIGAMLVLFIAVLAMGFGVIILLSVVALTVAIITKLEKHNSKI